MKLAARIALLAVTALAAGCDRDPSAPAGSEPLQVASPDSATGFVRGDPRLRVAHSGVRRIEFTTGEGGSHAFRESIATDGQGRFSIRPLEFIVPGSLDWGIFELQQLTREGYLFRYRDFAVRDPLLFGRNWVLIEHPRGDVVASRVCRRYRAERAADASAYELWVDAETELVLASEQYDATGQRIARMRYESVDLTPNLAGAIWHVDVLGEEALDLRGSLGEQLDYRTLEPRLLPAGYARVAAATVDDDAGKTWLRLTYGDGVESLFFFQALIAPTAGKLARSEAPSTPSRLPAATSSVIVFRVGAARAIQGFVDGFEVMLVGTAAEVELLDMLESALP